MKSLHLHSWKINWSTTLGWNLCRIAIAPSPANSFAGVKPGRAALVENLELFRLASPSAERGLDLCERDEAEAPARADVVRVGDAGRFDRCLHGRWSGRHERGLAACQRQRIDPTARRQNGNAEMGVDAVVDAIRKR